jgi:lipoprotein-releasing system permease protein
MKPYFVFFTALRYLKARRRSKGFMSSLLSIFGVAVGLVALVTVIAVINGFQLNYMNNLLEISSYHVQVTSPDGSPLSAAALSGIRALPGVTAVVPFREFEAIYDRASHSSTTNPGTVRAVDVDAALADESFVRHLFGDEYAPEQIESMRNDFAVRKDGTVAVGYLLANYLGVQENSEIILSSIDQLSPTAEDAGEGKAASRRLTVSCVFKSGYRDIDEYFLFMSLGTGESFMNQDKVLPLHYGIKLTDRFSDIALADRIKSLAGAGDYRVTSWRELNKSYFGALLMEKVAMFFLVGLIFIVVGFNIFNSLRRIVYEKYEEIALLRAIGATPGAVRTIFVFEGLLIGLIGGCLGTFTGLFLAVRVNALFAVVTDALNVVIKFAESAISNFTPVYFEAVESPFSPRIYYLKEVPSVVIPEEIILMFLFAVLSAAGAAFLASKKISLVAPSEVLRYE